MTNTPDTYLGAEKLFAEKELEKAKYFNQPISEIQHLRKLHYYNDAMQEDWANLNSFPYDHKKDHKIEELPKSLKRAIKVFLLINAIRHLRGVDDHCTMLINVSRFIDIHHQISGKVWEYREELKNDIFANAKTEKSGESERIKDLEKIFIAEFPGINENWDDIKNCLYEAIKEISEVKINSESDAIEFEDVKKGGQAHHKIIIGGFSLSRGLTIEGLTVSYLVRKPLSSDTLMQMGRFFGYRLKYRDLTRIYLTEDTAETFQKISHHMQELRADMEVMIKEKATPQQFGLKIRDNVDINLTSSNKLRYSETIDLSLDMDGKRLEADMVFNNNDKNQQNREEIRNLISNLGEPHNVDKNEYFFPNNCHAWQDIKLEEIIKFIENFQLPEGCTYLSKLSGIDKSSLFNSYCKELQRNNFEHIRFWDVIFPFTKKVKLDDQNLVPEDLRSVIKINSKETGRCDKAHDNWEVIKLGGNNKVISSQRENLSGISYKNLEKHGFRKGSKWIDAKEAVTRHRQAREKPLLTLFSLRIKQDKSDVVSNLKAEMPFASYSIISNYPEESKKHHFERRRYKATKGAADQLAFDYYMADETL